MDDQMSAKSDAGPAAVRPHMFGGYPKPKPLAWRWATARLTEARHYWIATTRPDGRSHCRPVWGVWHEGAFYFSTGSLAWKNIAQNPAISVNLESGHEVVILEGIAEVIHDEALIAAVAAAYYAKYHWEIEPDDPPYVVRPRVAFGWISDPSGLDQGSTFNGTATRWEL